MTTFFLLLGLAFLGVIAAILVREDWQMLRAPRVRCAGEVVGHIRSSDDGSEFYAARIRFCDERGECVEFVDSYGVRDPRPAVGSPIDIVYPQGQPRLARVPRPLVRLTIYAFVLGSLLLLTGLLLGFIGH
jgi:hypothetical protein